MDARKSESLRSGPHSIASQDGERLLPYMRSDVSPSSDNMHSSPHDTLRNAFPSEASPRSYLATSEWINWQSISVSSALKRVIDVTVATLGLIAVLPLFLVIAVAIKLDSGLPVIFKQTRTGRGGKLFRIYKFRTMTAAEDLGTVTQARQGDRRITRVGRYLRATSLDELPQLLNVVLGDMSLVGPRPHALAHDQYYSARLPDYVLRQRVRPGITGWAQVNGHRGETPELSAMARRLELDNWYIEHWSLWLDIKILARTILFEFGHSRSAF